MEMIFILTTKLENGYKSTCPLFPEWSLTYSGTDWNEFEKYANEEFIRLVQKQKQSGKKIDELPIEAFKIKHIVTYYDAFCKKIDDILLAVSWREVAGNYLHKTPKWLYEHLNGIDDEKNIVEFTEEEKQELKHALTDLAKRINAAADKI